MAFALHQQLATDTVDLGHFCLSKALLMQDANYPWVILVPERESVRELFELHADDQKMLLHEMTTLSQAMCEAFQADKMNVATLGNMVPQLHIHLIVRYMDDAAWPKPVWGAVAPKVYTKELLAQRVDLLQELIARHRV